MLLVCGLLLMYPALLTLADVLGAEFDQFPAGAVVLDVAALAAPRCIGRTPGGSSSAP